MKRLFQLFFWGFFLAFISGCHSSSDGFIYPEKEFPVLFTDVQHAGVFDDDKTFADCKPRKLTWIINSNYRIWRAFHQPDELLAFIQANFKLPENYSDSIPYARIIEDHIVTVNQHLQINNQKQVYGSSLIPLPNNFIIPGGRFREAYYWDTYFTLLGYAALNQKEIIYQTTSNLAWLIDRFGFVPNGNRSYYLTRSQPPYFSYMVDLNAQLFSDTMYLHFLPQLEQEYRFWMEKRSVTMTDSQQMNRYFDASNEPRTEMYRHDRHLYQQLKNKINDSCDFYRNLRGTAESGWDFSSRWFADSSGISSIETIQLLPVDLNCLLYHLEKTLAYACQINHDLAKQQQYENLANRRKKQIEDYFWVDSLGYYFDYNFEERKNHFQYTLAGVYPLFTNAADSIQAYRVASKIRLLFLEPGGVVTTLEDSGEQWDFPNGWAPLQWITIAGLRNYGYITLADTIKERWMNLNKIYFNKHHKLIEKYNVVDTLLRPRDGEYPAQDGFGWTNGVYLNLRLNHNPEKYYTR